MKIVIDTNTLIQSFNQISFHHRIWKGIITEEFTLIVSNSILFEYEEILQRKFSYATAVLIHETIFELSSLIFVDPHYNWNEITADPDDNKFFDAAVAGNADYIVTNDKHFNSIRTLAFPKVNVISSDDFLQLISKS
jgi:putative PIN family toxin of toxin-antitoxin system